MENTTNNHVIPEWLLLGHKTGDNNDLTYERFRTKDYVRNFNLFMQNEPKFYNPYIILTTYPERTYNSFGFSDFPKNEPKRTKNEPKVKIGKIAPNPLSKNDLQEFPPLRTYKNEPKRTQNKPNSNPVLQTPVDFMSALRKIVLFFTESYSKIKIMLYFYAFFLVLLNSIWLAMVPFALPGNWLIVITTALFAWWRAEDGVFSIYTLIAITILALIGELVEFFAGMGGARKAGAGFRGSIGAIIGAITGAVVGTFLIPIPFFGTLFGSCLGAGLGAWGFELIGGRQVQESLRFGFGASLGQFLGVIAKLLIGFIIWLTVAVAAFWP